MKSVKLQIKYLVWNKVRIQVWDQGSMEQVWDQVWCQAVDRVREQINEIR